MQKVLVSACLLGERVRYDGRSLPVTDQVLAHWRNDRRIVPVCPEVMSGMSVPRIPAEILAGNGNDVLDGNACVIARSGQDVTDYFLKGAEIALALCKTHQITIAVLSESSPSCGTHTIYDGRFIKNKISGVGVTTALLQRNAIKVFSQFELAQANNLLFSSNDKKI